MQRTVTIVANLLLVIAVPTAARAQLKVTVQPRAESEHSSRYTRSREGLNRQFQHHHEGNCHPSRGAVLAEIVRRAEPNGVKSREVRAQLAVIRKTLTVEERREAQKIRLIALNQEKRQEKLVKERATAGGSDRPRDPFLDQLAQERAARTRTTGR